MNIVKPISIFLVVGTILVLFILRPFGLFMEDGPADTTTSVAVSPDELLAALPIGQEILTARDISRFDGDEALLRIDRLDQRGIFQEHPLYQAYYFMVMNNIMLRLGRLDDAFIYAERLLEFAEQENMQWVKASALSELAIQRAKRGELDIALNYLDESVRIAKKINYEGLLIKSYNTLGVISNISGQYTQAQAFFHNGLKLVERNPDHLYYSKIISNLALIYINLEDWHKALEYIEKSKEIYGKNKWSETSIQTILFVNESNVYFNLNDASQARRAYLEANNTLVKESSVRLQAIVVNALSNVLYLEQNYEEAIVESTRCLNLDGVEALPVQLAQCHTSRARSEIKLENYFIAIDDLNEAIENSIAVSNSVYLYGYHKLLSEVFEEMGNDSQALKYFKLYYLEHKNALFDRRQSELYLLEESFNAETARNALTLLKTQGELRELELERKTLGVRVVFGMSFCVLLGLGYVIRKNLDIKKKNEVLQCSNTDLVELSTRDALTGLYNRRYFDDYIRGLKQDSSFYDDSSFTLAIMDLDHFKTINDNYGHDIGDMVLIEVAKRFLKYLPSSDLVIRWGGEEFICLIEDQGDITSLHQLEKVWLAIKDVPVLTTAGYIDITLSIGAVTDIPVKSLMATHTDLVKCADERLYKAKQGGRNQIIALGQSSIL